MSRVLFYKGILNVLVFFRGFYEISYLVVFLEEKEESRGFMSVFLME